jgi:protein-tyrosine kinase
MNTIEQAAKRLEALRRAGIQVDEPALTPLQREVQGVASTNHSASADAAVQAAPAGSQVATPSLAVAWATDTAPDRSAAASEAQAQPAGDFVDTVAPEAPSQRRSKSIDMDFARMQQAGLLVPGMPRSQLEEEVRIVKRPLLDNIRADETIRPARANLIMVTSALSGEGKTQTAINLAISIASELDYTVLLVEADVIRPAVLARLGVHATQGLLDLLENPGLDLADVLLKTNVPKLTLLPAGTASVRSTELLASTAMDDLLDELASKYADRVIIFDTPPVMSTTESRALATHMGQVVMVVEAERTPTSTVKLAFDTVESHPLVLAMLNKYRGPKANSPYGYYAP